MTENRKKIITSNNNRKTQNDKLKEALAKKPTASYLNAKGIKIDQIVFNEASKQKLIKEKIIKNAKNRKRFNNRSKILHNITNNKSFMEVVGDSGESYEWETPNWFRSEDKVDVSVIVPLFKSHEVVKDLIKSFPLNNKLSVEIIFVDDNCPNDSKSVVIKAWELRKGELKSKIGKVIYNPSNKGYGQACNAGARFASGDYLIFLNADTRATPNWIEPIVQLFSDPSVGLVGNMHLKEGGMWNNTIDSAGSEWKWSDMAFVHIGRHCYKKQGIPRPFNIENTPKDLLEISEREMVTGCCFAITKKLFDYIGGFNPNYKIGYWEDSEICLNVKELGYKILFQPNSIIYHKLGHTSSGGHKYFGHNRQYFENKWVKSHRLDKLLLSEGRLNGQDPVKTILIKRSCAHGDVLVATGVCSALKQKYPQAKILFSTLYPDVLMNNPFIDKFIETVHLDSTEFDLFYNLDLAYEWRPNINILTSYAELVGVKTEDCKVHLTSQPTKFSLPEDFVVIHAGKTNWAGRDWPTENFAEIAKRLMDMGENVVAIGKYTEDEIPCTLNTKGKTSIPQMAHIMEKAKLFIGIDSLPMHIAQTKSLKGVAFFGCVSPESRIYDRNMHGIVAKNVSCLGCHHRKPAPSTVTKNCETQNLDCIKKLTVNEMWFKVQEMLEEINHGNLSLLG